jgi:hypothetical protein
MLTIVGWVTIALMAGLIVGWLVTFAMDPEAFQKGAKR